MTIVLVECVIESVEYVIQELKREGFIHDEEYSRIPVSDNTVLIRGNIGRSGSSITKDLLEAAVLKKKIKGVVEIWPSTNTEVF